jgi:hypothetical protein
MLGCTPIVPLSRDPEAVQKHVAICAGASVDIITLTKLHVLEAAMQTAAKDVLIMDGRRNPGWFLAARRSLEPVLAESDRSDGGVHAWRIRAALGQMMRREAHAQQCDGR